mgnify:CR=1 FL=1
MANLLIVAGAQPQFVTDLIRLLNDAMTWLLIISAAAAVVLGLVFILQWMAADENEKPAAKKKIKTVVIAAVIAVAFEGIMKFILSYFIH